jgi:hypothetical protein
MSTEDGEVLWFDEVFDASRGTRRSSDEADALECEDHLVDAKAREKRRSSRTKRKGG